MLLPAGTLSAATAARILLVARDLDEHPLAGLRFAFAGVASQPTSQAGATELDLPPDHPAGQQIKIQLLPGTKQADDWFLVAPQINVPKAAAATAAPSPIVLTRYRS